MRAGTNLAILLVALVMGALAAFLARDWLASHTAAVAQEDNGTIVMTTAPLAFGDQLTPDNLVEARWPSKSVPEGAFTKVQDLLKDGKRVALAAFVRNEPVVQTKVSGPNQRASLSTVIEAGKRAITISVDDVRGVAGFIFPGDFVDIVLTRTANGESTKGYSEVFLQHVKVLGIDQLADARQDHPTVAKAVTVEVTPEEALKVSYANNVGKLSLILRQATEKAGEAQARVTEGDLFPADSAGAAAPPVVMATPEQIAVAQGPVSDINTRQITIVRALEEKKYTVPRDQK